MAEYISNENTLGGIGMSKPELKPCPFCGGKAVWEENHDLIGNKLFKGYKVKCSKCRCSPYPNKYSGDKNELAEIWNRRAEG